MSYKGLLVEDSEFVLSQLSVLMKANSVDPNEITLMLCLFIGFFRYWYYPEAFPS